MLNLTNQYRIHFCIEYLMITKIIMLSYFPSKLQFSEQLSSDTSYGTDRGVDKVGDGSE